MLKFTLYSLDTAPTDAKPLLENSIKSFGMLPNLHAVMAECPQLLNSYQQAHNLFQSTSFNNEELTVVWQTINIEHNCHYCIPAHTAIAHMMEVDKAIIASLLNSTPLDNNKLETLRITTLAMVRNRGELSTIELENFFDAGYGKQQLLEIVLGISQKIMSNYTNHLANTPVDEPFKAFM
ncbi:carboxymuconolactone decarboxylase family protein [Thalassotalea fonticola]|uniref:Carboxymuconolactone decarboxylase family protein n=1 Tax=Thalassotalea fonticola TaxID=3065649 RepID=A0ABZ0GRC1_9GAMM|nr:carboxymuconolactone decarboxylase family protein [Colwelliaceae bacterium S1-1]